FFFQAEDGIRDFHVTGVQTCALPISGFFQALDLRPIEGRVFTTEDLHVGLEQAVISHELWMRRGRSLRPGGKLVINGRPFVIVRSEERRVGKEWRSRSWPRPYR